MFGVIESCPRIVLPALTGLPGVILVLVGGPILPRSSNQASRGVNLEVVADHLRGGPPTTSRLTLRNAGLLDRVKIGQPTRTRVTPDNTVSVGITIVGELSTTPKNSRVAAAVLLDYWFVCKQRIFLSCDVVKGVGYYHGIFM